MQKKGQLEHSRITLFPPYVQWIVPFTCYWWDGLLPQVTMTLNMLRRSGLKPELSTYEQLDEIHHFEHTPLAPLGCEVENNEKPHKWLSYAPHSVDGCYLGPALYNYICYTWYNVDTWGKNTPNIIDFFPLFMKIPRFRYRDMAIHDVEYLSKTLQKFRQESPFQVREYQLKSIR